MSGAFEGDLVRPLGVVTLYFGYAEFEVNALLQALGDVMPTIDVSPNAPLGQKLGCIAEALAKVPGDGVGRVLKVLEDAKPLLDRRNQLVHSCILAKGRVVPNDSTRPEFQVTPEDLIVPRRSGAGRSI